MDDSLKKRLRTAYKIWTDTCDHCQHAEKEMARDVFREAVERAVAHANTLALPPEYGELRFNAQHFPYDVAYWTGGFASGVMHGDDMDGQPASWYWMLPTKGRHAHFASTPGDALIRLVEHLEEEFGPRAVGSSPETTT